MGAALHGGGVSAGTWWLSAVLPQLSGQTGAWSHRQKLPPSQLCALERERQSELSSVPSISPVPSFPGVIINSQALRNSMSQSLSENTL